MEELSLRLNATGAALKKAEAAVTELEAVKSTVCPDNATLQKELSALRDRLRETKAHVVALEQNSVVKEYVSTLESMNLRLSEIISLENQLAELKKEKEALEKELTDKVKELEKMKCILPFSLRIFIRCISLIL